jgi:hypothetical protein
MSQWRKLQTKLYDLISPDINLQLHCGVYRMNSSRGSTNLPRYWITLDKEIIWDYPKLVREYPQLGASPLKWYPYNTDIGAISDLFREYIDTPVELLFEKHFENDHWELTNILKAADRRIGQRRLHLLKKRIKNQAAHKVLMKRIEVLSIRHILRKSN